MTLSEARREGPGLGKEFAACVKQERIDIVSRKLGERLGIAPYDARRLNSCSHLVHMSPDAVENTAKAETDREVASIVRALSALKKDVEDLDIVKFTTPFPFADRQTTLNGLFEAYQKEAVRRFASKF